MASRLAHPPTEAPATELFDGLAPAIARDFFEEPYPDDPTDGDAGDDDAGDDAAGAASKNAGKGQ